MTQSIKFQIDGLQFKQLVARDDSELGNAIVDDVEVQKGISISLETRDLIVRAFETGYAAALNNVTKLIEMERCQSSAKREP